MYICVRGMSDRFDYTYTSFIEKSQSTDNDLFFRLTEFVSILSVILLSRSFPKGKKYKYTYETDVANFFSLLLPSLSIF